MEVREVSSRGTLRAHKVLYDEETGEIYKEQDYEEDKFKIFNNKQRMFRKRMYANAPDLNKSDLGCWFILMRYLEQNTNRLVKRKFDEYRISHIPLDRQDLENVLNMSQSSIYRFLRRNLDRGYIAQVDVGTGKKQRTEYYLSPKYVMNGGWISPELALKFADSKDFVDFLTKSDKRKIRSYIKTVGKGKVPDWVKDEQVS